MDFLTIYDSKLGDSITGPITINFRHIFDRPVSRVELKTGSVLVGDVVQSRLGIYTVTISPTQDEEIDINLNADEIAKISEIIPGNHQVIGQTICTIFCPKTGQTFEGKAFCGREDRYSRRLGRAISFVRAWFDVSKAVGTRDFSRAGLDAFFARNYRVAYFPSAEEFPELKYVAKAIKEKMEDYFNDNYATLIKEQLSKYINLVKPIHLVK